MTGRAEKPRSIQLTQVDGATPKAMPKKTKSEGKRTRTATLIPNGEGTTCKYDLSVFFKIRNKTIKQNSKTKIMLLNLKSINSKIKSMQYKTYS